jgi:mRNA interferase HigB
MHIISPKRLRNFWTRFLEAMNPLRAWIRNAEHAHWQNFADVRKDYPSADLVGQCVVFNIGGNKFRLVVKIQYKTGRIYIIHIMTHDEYDKGTWKKDCCGP